MLLEPKTVQEFRRIQMPNWNYLYTTATCPNCRSIKPILKKSGILFEERDVEQYIQEATALGLTQAPSLVVQSDSPVVYAGVTKIKEFLKQM